MATSVYKGWLEFYAINSGSGDSWTIATSQPSFSTLFQFSNDYIIVKKDINIVMFLNALDGFVSKYIPKGLKVVYGYRILLGTIDSAPVLIKLDRASYSVYFGNTSCSYYSSSYIGSNTSHKYYIMYK